jgi:hypothetical protein
MKIVVYGGIICVTILLIFANCITTQKANFTIEDLSGTWINEEYNAIDRVYDPKEVVTADGVVKTYDKLTDKEPNWMYKLSIGESWYDENGDIWFKCVWELTGLVSEVSTTNLYYSINKLSSSGTVWECCWKASDYPTEFSQLGGGYTTHYRQ